MDGVLSIDSIALNEYKATNVKFIESTRYDSSSGVEYDGIVGFMHAPFYDFTDGTSRVIWYQALFSQNPDISQIFSFCVYEGEESGEIVIGGVNNAQIDGDIQILPLETEYANSKGTPLFLFWSSSLLKATVPSKGVSKNVNELVMFDTGRVTFVLY